MFVQGDQVREVLDKEETKLDHSTEELLQKGAGSFCFSISLCASLMISKHLIGFQTLSRDGRPLRPPHLPLHVGPLNAPHQPGE